MRLEWMDKLRDTLSEFHSILMIKENVDKEKDAVKLSHLGTEIDLLLNRDDKIQRELWDITDKIYKCEAIEERQEMDEELVSAGRAVLKSEWEKVKAEMRGEAFKTGEHTARST
jgi:predicted  nucleic acid-binding Zn-ribbon protein